MCYEFDLDYTPNKNNTGSLQNQLVHLVISINMIYIGGNEGSVGKHVILHRRIRERLINI